MYIYIYICIYVYIHIYILAHTPSPMLRGCPSRLGLDLSPCSALGDPPSLGDLCSFPSLPFSPTLSPNLRKWPYSDSITTARRNQRPRAAAGEPSTAGVRDYYYYYYSYYYH